MTCPQLLDSGVYVLGALPPAQRLAYERHLAICAECRAEVGDLAVLPGLLGRLDEPEVTAVGAASQAPSTVLTGALARVRRQRRVRRFAASAVAAGVAAVALVAGLSAPHSTGGLTAVPSPSPPAISTSPSISLPPSTLPPSSASPTIATFEMTPVGDAGSVTARVGLVPVANGTEIQLTCWYGPGSSVKYHGRSAAFSLYLILRGDHAPAKVRTWWAEPGDMARLPTVTHWPIGDVVRLELRNASGRTLLQYTLS